MYRYKKRLWVCEDCGSKVEIPGLREDGKHVCGKCSYKNVQTNKGGLKNEK